MKKELLCIIFGHQPINEIVAFSCENPDKKKGWTTYQAKCKRCNCTLISLEQFGEYSQQLVKGKFIKII